ncbi:uncharacterized protein N7511_011518 [Penicillium nucicola]|uniref:uncharacterized protein n=1 Tax=Penicillium nucicola TaxID=1850975 RepID=UPI002544ECD5|nr:uncharacterized protein N7511_011518 [Penicillium nucicola]KAJ5742499.1 hypothetical protein N7511_011518 [Penicillium nucicola]
MTHRRHISCCKVGGKIARFVDIKKRSAIWYAIDLCDESLVQSLLKRGSDKRTPDYKDVSPFCLAVTKTPPKIARLILLNSDPDSKKILLEDVALRNRLLCRAVQASLRDVIALLVAHGADTNSRNRDGQSLLHQATKKGDREVVQQLLTYEDISINATYRTLHIAAEYECTSVAKCLLAKCGIESNARDCHGRTAVHIAAEYGNKLITRLLLAYGAVDINARDANGATALCLAVKEKHTAAALQILAEDHADLNVAGQNGWTALHHAVSVGNIPVACVLLDNDHLNPNLRDDEGWPPLTHAASNGDLRMVELLLARTDVQVNVHQAPPLFHAAKQGHVEVVRRLLSFDTIDINQQFWNSSPLCVASEIGYPEVTKLLLQHTAPPDTNLKTYMGDTALSLAAYHGNLVIIKLLQEVNGFDVATADNFGDTALCKAARNGHEQIVKRLYRDARAKCASDVKGPLKQLSPLELHCILKDTWMSKATFALGLELQIARDCFVR